MTMLALMLLAAAGDVAGLDTKTVTTGAQGTAVNLDRVRGYLSAGLGAIAPNNISPIPAYATKVINTLCWNENGGAPQYVLAITGATTNNPSDWTSLTIGGRLTLLRASATFSAGTWTWAAPGTNPGVQAFGTAGSNVVCTFT